MQPPLVQRVSLRNFKSFEKCDISLEPLTVLVGRNGSGKSNFLDALEFTKDAVEKSLDFAVRERAGIDGVRRRSRLHRPTHAHVEIRFSVPGGYADYGYQLGDIADSYDVRREECRIRTGTADCSFRIRRGQCDHWSIPNRPAPGAIEPDRLVLPTLSGIPELRPVYDAILGMAFHNLNPDAMKRPVRPDTQRLLASDGHNIPTIIETLPPDQLRRVIDYLNQITGYHIDSITRRSLGSFETLVVALHIADAKKPWTFDAASMSDGTLRVLGILASAFTPANGSIAKSGPRLIAIEEPENAIHPAAAGILADALVEASTTRQVLITTHSPDLIEADSIDPDRIRLVVHLDGRSQIGRINAEKIDLIRSHLTDAGELLRQDQLTLDTDDVERQLSSESLFDEP